MKHCLHVVQAFRSLETLHRVLVESLAQVTDRVEQATDIAANRLRPEPDNSNEAVPVSAVLQAALFGNRFDDLGLGLRKPFADACGRAPAASSFLAGRYCPVVAGGYSC